MVYCCGIGAVCNLFGSITRKSECATIPATLCQTISNWLWQNHCLYLYTPGKAASKGKLCICKHSWLWLVAMNETDIVPIGTKVIFKAGSGGDTEVIGIVKENQQGGKFPYLIRLIRRFTDVRNGRPLEMEWHCTRSAIVEILQDDPKPDPIKAYDRAMRGIWRSM